MTSSLWIYTPNSNPHDSAKQFQNEIGMDNIFTIQHHFAHTASLMVDNNVGKDIPVVVSTLDGVGYGSDGNVWGGEIIRGTYEEMHRTHHFSHIPMVGGDLCVTYPARMVTGFLLESYETSEVLEYANKLGVAQNLPGKINELEILISSYKLRENIAYSSQLWQIN